MELTRVQYGVQKCSRLGFYPRDKQIAELERRALRAEARADRYERLCALQKKVSELFGIPLETESETKP